MRTFVKIFGIIVSLMFLLEAVLAVNFPEAKGAAHLDSLNGHRTRSAADSQTRSRTGSSGESSGRAGASSYMSFGGGVGGGSDASRSSRTSSDTGSSSRSRY